VDTAGYSSWIQIFQLAVLGVGRLCYLHTAKFGELEDPAVSAVTPKADEMADGINVKKRFWVTFFSFTTFCKVLVFFDNLIY